MSRAYLTFQQAAELLWTTPHTVRRMVLKGELPALRVGTLYRIEALAVRRLAQEESPLFPNVPTAAQSLYDAQDPLEGLPELASVPFLVKHLGVSDSHLRRLVERGELPMWQSHDTHDPLAGRWLIGRRPLMRWIIDHTSGDDANAPL